MVFCFFFLPPFFSLLVDGAVYVSVRFKASLFASTDGLFSFFSDDLPFDSFLPLPEDFFPPFSPATAF
jgi:hypothetical protein